MVVTASVDRSCLGTAGVVSDEHCRSFGHLNEDPGPSAAAAGEYGTSSGTRRAFYRN